MKLPRKVIDQQITELELWIRQAGYDLVYSRDTADEVDFVLSQMTINERQSRENMYYTMLHECGHINAEGDQETWMSGLPLDNASRCTTDGRRKRSIKWKIGELVEEIDAWRIGKQLANHLGHKLNDDNFNKVYARCVHTYVKYF